MVIGFLIIIIVPFVFYYTQINNLNQKVVIIKKAINERKETYIDTVDMCERWTATGEKVYHCKWVYTAIKTEDAIEGDDVLMGLNSHKVYRNYSKERFIQHIQWQIDNGLCWCWDRSAYNKKNNADSDLKYHLKEKYFYYLGLDLNSHKYFICYYNTNKKEIIDFNKYKELGGLDWKDKTGGYK